MGARDGLRLDQRLARAASPRPAARGDRHPGRQVWWGERDVSVDNFWQREVRFKDHRGTGRVTHRPDLGLRLGGQPIPVEVELQRKSRARLRGILGMYEELATCDPPRFGGVFYVTGPSDIASRVMRVANDVGLGNELLTMRSYAEVIERARGAAAAL